MSNAGNNYRLSRRDPFPPLSPVHGFNRTFNISILRTAQLFFDLDLPGVPVAYSWPSEESAAPLNYTRAGTTAEWTVPHLKTVLQAIAEDTGAERISVVAHSMGNRVLTKALVEFAKEREHPLVHEVILAAPDIDAEIFERDIVPAMQNAAERFTLYASSDDKALKLSKTVNGYARAGDSGETLVVTPGLDTVDATGIDTSLLGTGHFYYGTMRSVLDDFRAIMINGLSPDKRNLKEQLRSGQEYWKIPEAAPQIEF